jgi:acetoacetyl-CoA synthetase
LLSASGVASEDVLWTPDAGRVAASSLTAYCDWLATERGLTFADYHDLWAWSVTEIEAFWESVWIHFQVAASAPYDCVLAERVMPGARWFPGSRLSYAEHIFRFAAADRPAIVAASESGEVRVVSWDELAATTGALAGALRAIGVGPGDRVAGYLTNGPEAVAALLAATSVGAVWACCSPDLAHGGVLDRLGQLEPRVLVATDGYRYGGRQHDRLGELEQIVAGLPGLEAVVMLPGRARRAPPWTVATWWWDDVLASDDRRLTFEQVPFDHPLWVLFTSGTTGRPKPVVHSHGGMLLEHLKVLGLQMDLSATDRFLWFTTTGWMIWNQLISTLLLGGTIVLYDGSPTHPNAGALWRLAADVGVTCLGVAPALLAATRREGIEPGDRFDLSRLRTVVSGGAPLAADLYDWVYRAVGPDLWLDNATGGTEVCSGLAGGSPFLPVHRGQLSCRYLGASVEAFDAGGRSVVDEVGELVITEPMPAMPVGLWGDHDGSRYRAAYFETYPGVWRHGDWVEVTSAGTCVVHGRSDATLNRHGVRMGTAEIYGALESHPAVADSLVVGLELPGGEYWVPAFVVLRQGFELDDQLVRDLKARVRERVSPRAAPDDVIAVAAVPRTLTGKKLEVPVKRLLLGVPVEDAVNTTTVADPSTLEPFVALAGPLAERNEGRPG